ncbi:MAG: glycosyltransferase [Acidobacteriota bacterium]
MSLSPASARTLYLCYFGLREPLVQTQVLPYLRQIAAAGIKVNLLTFEPDLRRDGREEEQTEQRERLMAEGIIWFCLPYHKSPSLPATLYDIVAGARFAVRMVRHEGVNVLHARAHVPMAMVLWARAFVSAKAIFDIRGLMAEEYVESGIWAEHSLPFRLVKRLERAGIRRADQIVVLTERMRNWLVDHNLKAAEQIEVIPCCVDFARFDNGIEVQSVGEDSTANRRFEVVYAGSLGGLYLVEEMGRFFKSFKEYWPDGFLRILSVSPPEQAVAALKRAGLNEHDFSIEAVSPAGVPAHLRRARLGISFRKASFAQIAASPTKIPEYLAVGLPVVCNEGIGDMDELVERERLGVVVRDFNEKSFQTAAEQAVTLVNEVGISERCRRIARQLFDLHTIGGQQYVNVYRRLEKMMASDSDTVGKGGR